MYVYVDSVFINCWNVATGKGETSPFTTEKFGNYFVNTLMLVHKEASIAKEDSHLIY